MPRDEYDDPDDRDRDYRRERDYDDEDRHPPERRRDERIARGKLLVRIPGVMMILVGLLGIGDKGWQLLNLDESLTAQDQFRQAMGLPPMNAAERGRQKTVTLVISAVGVAGAVLGVIGGICMVAVTGHRLALTSAVVAIIPVLHGCCFLSTCVGIYALVMLLNGDVREAFARRPAPRHDHDRGRFDDEYDRRDR